MVELLDNDAIYLSNQRFNFEQKVKPQVNMELYGDPNVDKKNRGGLYNQLNNETDPFKQKKLREQISRLNRSIGQGEKKAKKAKSTQKTYKGKKLHKGHLEGLYYIDEKGKKIYVEKSDSKGTGITKKEAEKFRKTHKVVYPFEECVKKNMEKGYSEEVSKKICASIRRRRFGGDEEEDDYNRTGQYENRFSSTHRIPISRDKRFGQGEIEFDDTIRIAGAYLD